MIQRNLETNYLIHNSKINEMFLPLRIIIEYLFIFVQNTEVNLPFFGIWIHVHVPAMIKQTPRVLFISNLGVQSLQIVESNNLKFRPRQRFI